MLTLLKKIFIWWNQETIGTKLQTIFFGKLVGEDDFGNKYYKNKSNKRWVIYNGEVDASKIPNEWYSWIHFINNNIQNTHNFNKYDWQKPHQSNKTGSEKSYHPNRNNDKVTKKYTSWKS